MFRCQDYGGVGYRIVGCSVWDWGSGLRKPSTLNPETINPEP